MRFLIGVGLFWAGIGGFAIASTSGQPEVFMWWLSAMIFIGGAGIILMDYIKDDVK